jgi:DNA replicative helicase MCM subunit Mcm2 (Cdc46/Mcm family)
MQIAKLKEISKLPHIYELLTRSLAPSIWELEDIKKGLLCQVCLAAPDILSGFAVELLNFFQQACLEWFFY